MRNPPFCATVTAVQATQCNGSMSNIFPVFMDYQFGYFEMYHLASSVGLQIAENSGLLRGWGGKEITGF